MSQPAEDTRRKLYDRLSSDGITLPDFEKFNTGLDDPKTRIALYKRMSADGITLPEYEIFDRKLFRPSKPIVMPEVVTTAERSKKGITAEEQNLLFPQAPSVSQPNTEAERKVAEQGVGAPSEALGKSAILNPLGFLVNSFYEGFKSADQDWQEARSKEGINDLADLITTGKGLDRVLGTLAAVAKGGFAVGTVASPALAKFTGVLGAAGELAPKQTEGALKVAMQPVSTALSEAGIEPGTYAQKKYLELADLIGMTAIAMGAHIGARKLVDISLKMKAGQPITPAEIKTVSENLPKEVHDAIDEQLSRVDEMATGVVSNAPARMIQGTPKPVGLVEGTPDARFAAREERIRELMQRNPNLREVEAEALADAMPAEQPSSIIRPAGETSRTGETASTTPEIVPQPVQAEAKKPTLPEGGSESIIPVSFRKKMVDELVATGEKVDFVRKLSDTELSNLYRQKGLDRPAPISEAPVSRGGSMEVRGPANEAQIAKSSPPSPKAEGEKASWQANIKEEQLPTPTEQRRGLASETTGGIVEKPIVIYRGGKPFRQEAVEGQGASASLSEETAKLYGTVTETEKVEKFTIPSGAKVLVIPSQTFTPAEISYAKRFGYDVVMGVKDLGQNEVRIINPKILERPLSPPLPVGKETGGEKPIKVGELVGLSKPVPGGRSKIAGTVSRIMPDGKIEVRTQQDGIFFVPESELVRKPAPTPDAKGLQGIDPKPDIDPKALDPDKLKNFQTLLDELGVNLKVVGPDGKPLTKTSIQGAIEDWNHDKGDEFTWRAQALLKALDEAYTTGIVEVRPGPGQPHVEMKVDDLIADKLEREGMQEAPEEKKPLEDQFVEGKLKEGNLKPAIEREQRAKQVLAEETKARLEAELSGLVKQQAQIRREIESGLATPEKQNNARWELERLNKRIGSLKDRLDSSSMFDNQIPVFSLASMALSMPSENDDENTKKIKAILGAVGLIGMAVTMTPRGRGVLNEIEQEARLKGSRVTKVIADFLKEPKNLKGLAAEDVKVLGKLATDPNTNRVTSEIARIQSEKETFADIKPVGDTPLSAEQPQLKNLTPVEKSIAATINPAVKYNDVDIAKNAESLIDKAPVFASDFVETAEAHFGDAKSSARTAVRNMVRATTYAALEPKFKGIFDKVGDAERKSNKNLYDIEQDVETALKGLTPEEMERVATQRYKENLEQGIYTDVELAKKGYSEKEIASINSLRIAQSKVLDIRRDMLIRETDERIEKIQIGLERTTAKLEEMKSKGAGAEKAVEELTQQKAGQEKLLSDAREERRGIENHYQDLKDTGYLSLKRNGNLWVVAEDLSKAEDAPDRFVYDAGRSRSEQTGIARRFESQGYKNIQKYKVEQLPYEFKAKLTPSELDDVIEASGANPLDPDVQKLYSEVLSRFPTTSYQLSRRYVPGYEPSMQNLLKTMFAQGETYNNTAFKRVGRMEALRALKASGISETSETSLYGFTKKYIEDSFQSIPGGAINKAMRGARKLTYVMQLGLDPAQFLFNGVLQPVMVTRPYFNRAEFKMGLGEADKYFVRAMKLAGQTTTKSAPKEFQSLYERAVAEGVATAEMAREVADIQARKESKVMHGFSYFTRSGEEVTRAHTLAEAYLVGTEKLKLKGDALYRFMVDSNSIINGKQGRGEVPGIVRHQNLGEFGRMAYQFQSYVSLYLENLALNLRNDYKAGKISAPVFRKSLGALAIIGGVGAFPGAGIASKLYANLTGHDPKEDLDDAIGEFWSDQVMWGSLRNESFSNRIGILNRVPEDEYGRGIEDYLPAVSTAKQMYRAVGKAMDGEYLRALEGITPKGLKMTSRISRYATEGVVVKEGEKKKTLVPPEKLDWIDYATSAGGFANEKLTEYYRKKSLKVTFGGKPMRDLEDVHTKLLMIEGLTKESDPAQQKNLLSKLSKEDVMLWNNRKEVAEMVNRIKRWDEKIEKTRLLDISDDVRKKAIRALEKEAESDAAALLKKLGKK